MTKLSLVLLSCLVLPGVARADQVYYETCVIEHYDREHCQVCSADRKNPDACKQALDVTKDFACRTQLGPAWDEIWCDPGATERTDIEHIPSAVPTPDSDGHTRDASDPPEAGHPTVDAKQGCGGCASGGNTVPWSVGLLLCAAVLTRRRARVR